MIVETGTVEAKMSETGVVESEVAALENGLKFPTWILRGWERLRQLKGWWEWTLGLRLRLGRNHSRRLRIAESLALGERRFVAVLELDGNSFLLGGTAGSLVLLARLENENAPGGPSRPTRLSFPEHHREDEL